MIKVLPISVCEFLTDSQTKSKIIVQKKKETCEPGALVIPPTPPYTLFIRRVSNGGAYLPV